MAKKKKKKAAKKKAAKKPIEFSLPTQKKPAKKKAKLPAQTFAMSLLDAHDDFFAARDALVEKLGGSEKIASSFSTGQIQTAGLENFRGFGVGMRTASGRLTHEVAVKVLVKKKMSSGRLAAKARIPTEISGMPIDVEECGDFSSLAFDGQPARCGAGCAPEGVTFQGTMGCLVILENGRLALLSNNHVLADSNRMPLGTKVYHPYQSHQEAYQIGVLEDFVKIKYGSHSQLNHNPINYVDGAVCWTSRQLVDPAHISYQLNPSPVSASPGMSVTKHGITTGHTTGTIDMINAIGINHIPVGNRFGEVAWWHDQILVGPGAFSQKGDSGSLVVTSGTKQPVGLLFAGNDSHTIVNPIARVIEELGIDSFVAP